MATIVAKAKSGFTKEWSKKIDKSGLKQKAILVLKRCKKPNDFLFINASEHFEKGKKQNRLTPEHLAKIVDAYRNRSKEQRYSRRVGVEEIEKNDCDVSIFRYISTSVGEEEIDLSSTHRDLARIEESIQAATVKLKAFLHELGLPPVTMR